MRAHKSYDQFAARIANYFHHAPRRIRFRNPFVGIVALIFLFIVGFMIVTPLYLVVGPLVHVSIVLIAITWHGLGKAFGWYGACHGREKDALDTVTRIREDFRREGRLEEAEMLHNALLKNLAEQARQASSHTCERAADEAAE